VAEGLEKSLGVFNPACPPAAEMGKHSLNLSGANLSADLSAVAVAKVEALA